MSWLKDRWEELNAQVKMGDNKTASTVRAARKPAAPAQTMRANTNQPGWSVRKPQPAPLTTQQRISQSYGPTGFTGLKNYAKDMLFDNNSEADRIKRYAATGLNESYDQEQARKTKEAQASNDKLGTIHQVMKSLPAGTADFLTKTPGAIGQMQGRTAKMVNEIDNPLLRTGAKLVSAPLGGLMTTKQADTNIKTGRGLNERIDNKMQQSAFGDRADDNKYVTGAGKMFGQLGGQIATGGLGTVAIGSQMAADEANKAEAAGKSNTYSTLTGFGQGGIGALSEKYGVDKFIPGKGNVAGNFVTRMGKRIFTEGAQEGQQQFTQNYIANKAYNPNQSLKEGVLESALMGGLAGGAMSPAVDIMNRPTAPKPTTSLVAPKPEPTRTRLRPEEARIWSDYQETLYKGNRMPPEVVNQTHNKARQIADSLGVDIITGSPDEIAGRMNPLLEQSMAFQKEPTTGLVRPKPLNQSGYIQLPGGKDTQLNDTELGVVNYLNNKPIQEGSATQGEGNALPTELSAGKRQSYLDKMKKMVTPLNDGGYISLGAPEPKKLPQDIKNQFASQGSFGREAIDRIEANKMSKGDLERAGVIFDPKQVKKIAQTLPEFKANPVMTYRKGDYSYTDAGYGRYPVPEKARSGVFEFKHSRGTMRLNPEALFGKEMAQKLAQTAKDGEQVDFTDTMKASGNRLFTYDQTADIPTPTVAKPVQKQVTEKQNSVDPLESLKQEAKPPANAFQDTLPSKTRPDSIRELVKRGGNPLYHDTNANGVLGILDSGEIRANQAPFSSIAGQGKRVSTTRNFDNYSRYGKSPYRFVIDETKTGQKAIPDNREEFESIFKNNVKTDSVDSLTIDVTNPELINDMNNGRLAEVIAKAKEKGIRVETFEGKILPDEYANKEIQQMTKDKFTKEFGQATQSQPPKSPLANDPLESLKQEASYRMDHRPIKGDSVLDIAKGKDGLLATQSSKQGEAWQESAQAISKLKNSKPDDLVTVYRSSPKEQLNDGDWVTFSPSYAKMMADGKIDGSKVGSFRVPAKDVRYGGEDITEFGYFKSKPTTFEQNLQQAGLKPIQKNIPTAKLPAQTQDQLAASPNQESSKQQTQKTESGSSKLSPIPQVSEKTNAFASLQPSVQRTNESSKGLVLAEREAPNGQRIQKVRTGKGQVEERTTSNEIADALGIPQDQREPSFNAVAAAKNSSSAKRLVEALNMNDDITQAAAQAQQDGKEINFFAKKDANGRSVGVERFDPQYHKIDAGFVTDRNGNVLGNHIKVDSTGVQVNVGGDVVNMDRVLGNPIDWRNKYEASSTMERNIYQNAPTKEIADKTYKFTVGHKIQSEANYKTELQQQRKALTDRTKATLAAKPRRVKSEEYKADLFDFIENTSTYTDMIGKYGQSTAKVMSDYKTSTRTMYNDLLKRVNEQFGQFGMEQVPQRKDYLTHINELMDKKSYVGELVGQLQNSIADEGKDRTRGAIPTDIAGRSENFKPTKKWNRFFQERRGGEFSKDPFKAVDAYLEPTLHNIHMTESGVRTRAVEATFRTVSQLKNMDTSYVQKELGDSLVKFKVQGGNDKLVRGFQEYANAITGKTEALDRQVIDKSDASATALRGWQKLQSVGGRATILGNLNSVLMQPLNQIATMAQTNPANYLKGIAATISGDKTYQQSPFLKARNAKVDSYFRSKGQKFLDKGAVPLELVEKAAIRNTWNAQYQSVLKDGYKGKEAITETDRRTERTVAGRGIADRPELYRSTVANGVLQYTLEVNAQNKMFWRDLTPVQKAEFMVASSGVNMILGAVTGNTPMPDFVKAMFDSVMDFADGEDDDSVLENAGQAVQRVAGEAASMNPLVSAGANLLPKSARQVAFGKESDLGRYDGTSAPVQVVKNVVDTGSKLAQGKYTDARNSALKTVPFGNQIQKTWRGAEAISEGKTEGSPWQAAKAIAFGPNAINTDTAKETKFSATPSSSKGTVNASSVDGKTTFAPTADEILKNQFSTKEQKAWLKLSAADRKAEAEQDPEKAKWLKQYEATKRVNKNAPERPEGLSKESETILNWHNKRTPQQREKLAYTQNDYDYKLATAQFEEAKLNGTVSRAEMINKQQALTKAKVGKDFTKDTRESYNSLSKAELTTLAENDPNGRQIMADAIAYGDALVKAGLIKKNKLRTGSGSGGKRGGRGGKGKASKFDYTKNLFDSGSDSASTSKQLRAILEKAMSGKS